eukprot:g1230.t1
MPSGLRRWLVALRPWSFPVSIVPIAVTGAVLHKTRGVDLLTPDYVACFFFVLMIHAAANLTNTYFDFKNKVDKPESADDRGLVDGNVTPSGVLRLVVCLFLGAGAMAAYLTAAHGAAVLKISVPAMLMAFFYTADPFSLKAKGLGDITIFLCFGPMLAAGLSLVVAGEVVPDALVLSVPVGLLTCAILHVNNMRDIDADKGAGLVTLAILVGARTSRYVYLAQLGLPYLVVLCCGPAYGWRMCFIAASLPWALFLVKCVHAGDLAEMPQRTAQHNLLFGTALAAGLAHPAFLARVLLGCLFYLGGVNNIIMWSYVRHLVHQKLNNLVSPFLEIPASASTFALGASVALQLSSSICFMIGVATRPMAALMLLFLLPITFAVHDFWTITDDIYLAAYTKAKPASPQDEACQRPVVAHVSRKVPTFATLFDNEFVHFFKNIGMIGGLFIYLESGMGM